MSKADKPRRKPRSFAVDETPSRPEAKEAKEAPSAKRRAPKAVAAERVITTLPDEAAQRAGDLVASDAEIADALTPPPPERQLKRFRWSWLFIGALTGLISLALGLWVDQLVRELFARHDWLGWFAAGLTALLVLAALAIALRELWGLRRMATIQKLQMQGEKARKNNDLKEARKVLNQLVGLYDNRPDTARGRSALAQHDDAILDGRDLIHLAERDLLKPLDTRARDLVMASAKRVSVVTAVSPRAIVDLAYVLMENMRLVRMIAELYGGRPGSLGFWRLARNVLAHLAVTGSIAVGDGLLQQVVGHGLAARISTRLGEGVVNGLLTARIGIAAIDVCRPLDFSDQTRPTIRDFIGHLAGPLSGREEAETQQQGKKS